jgi:hypothetical protein
VLQVNTLKQQLLRTFINCQISKVYSNFNFLSTRDNVWKSHLRKNTTLLIALAFISYHPSYIPIPRQPKKKNRKYGYNIRWAMPWSKDHIFLANVLYYVADMNITPMLNI